MFLPISPLLARSREWRSQGVPVVNSQSKGKKGLVGDWGDRIIYFMVSRRGDSPEEKNARLTVLRANHKRYPECNGRVI